MRLKRLVDMLRRMAALSIAGVFLVSTGGQTYANESTVISNLTNPEMKGDTTDEINNLFFCTSSTNDSAIENHTCKKKKDGIGVSAANMSSDAISYSEQVINIEKDNRQILIAGNMPNGATVTVVPVSEAEVKSYLLEDMNYLCGYKILIFTSDGMEYKPRYYGESIQIFISNIKIPDVTTSKVVSVYQIGSDTDNIASVNNEYQQKNSILKLLLTDLSEILVITEPVKSNHTPSAKLPFDCMCQEPFNPDTIYTDEEEDEEIVEDENSDKVDVSTASFDWREGNLSIVYTIYSVLDKKYYDIRAGDIRFKR